MNCVTKTGFETKLDTLSNYGIAILFLQRKLNFSANKHTHWQNRVKVVKEGPVTDRGNDAISN